MVFKLPGVGALWAHHSLFISSLFIVYFQNILAQDLMSTTPLLAV